jgi:RNA polymerase sigma factor (sigma-70 family)
MSVPVPISTDWSAGCLVDEVQSVDRPVETSPLTPLVSDADLVRDLAVARAGSEQAQAALAQIVVRHGGLVYSVALRTVSDRTMADDVFQATFLVLVQSARKIQRSGSLSAWLHGTARNIGRRAISQRRARCPQAVEVEMLPACEVDPFLELERSHERDVLDEELQQLPEIDRAPLVLFYLEERSQREIAELLGISVPAVESRLKRAKQELRVRLVRRGVTLSVAVAAIGWGASAASAAPPAALVSSTLTLAATGTTVGTLTAAGSTAAGLAGKELAAMSAASKLTALVVGTAGTLTVSGALLFGAMVDGIVGPGSGESAVIATEVAGDGDEPVLLAQADEASDQEDTSVPEEKEAEAPSELKEDLPALAEKDLDATTKVEEKDEPATVDPVPLAEDDAKDEPKEEMPAEDSPGEAEEDAPRAPRTGPLVAAYRQLSEKDLLIYTALDEEVTFEFPDNTLREIADFLTQRTQVPVRFDEQALTDAGLDPDARVTFVGTHRLADSLAMICDKVNGTELAYYVDRGVLHITTKEAKTNTTRLRFYDLSDSGIENLTTAVQNYVNQLGNPPESITSLGDSLAVRASLTTHDEIEEFIAGAIRLADARRSAGKDQPVVPEPVPANPQGAGGLGGGGLGGGGMGGGGGGGFFRIPAGD